jgi:transposase
MGRRTTGRRTFSREYKLEAVRLVRDRGVSVAQAARDLGVHENVLRKWVKDWQADPRQAFPGQGQMKPEQAELDRLRREVAKLKAERDILKKAAAYFAKDHT